MPLSQPKLDKVVRHLQSKVRAGCPLCGERNWNVEQDLHFLGILDPEYKQPVQGSVMPTVTVTCQNCYFCFYLPAMKLGILDS